jgi:hypothetical protein
MSAAGKPKPEIIPLTLLPLEDIGAAAERLRELGEAGATGIDHPGRYSDVNEFSRNAESLLEAKVRAGY